MMLAAVFISGRDWVLPSALLFVAAVVILFWGYARTPADGFSRFISFLLKALGLAALGFCLLEPLWSFQRARPGSNFFAVVADNSQGMVIKDRGETRSRGEALRDLLTSEKSAWPAALEENFQLRRYLFDSRLQGTKDFRELQFDGRASAIGSALRVLADRYQGQPLAGVLLLTDGNATDAIDPTTDLSGLPPIYPVVVGKDDTIKDISILKTAVSQTAFEDAPVTVEATVTANGYAGSTILAQLFESPEGSRLDAAKKTNAPPTATRSNPSSAAVASTNAASSRAVEKMVAELSQSAPSEGEPMTFRFQVRPTKSGISFYRLRISAKDEMEQFTDAKVSTEATLANNGRMLVVDRGRGPYRVLYVAGRPNWEYAFLNRAIKEDDQVQLVGLIRVAKREPKSSLKFLGNRDDASNPLYRGFDKKGEDAERYDQPVLSRLNTRDESELAGGFPIIPEDLYGYHAIILDDLESEFFTRDQMTLIQKYVSERGGGFLMLAGAESFHQGHYERTPIGDVLPVYVDRMPASSEPPNAKMSLTREGWLQPWARLRNTEEEEKFRIDGMRGFDVLNRVRDLKPGASVLATVKHKDGKDYPALIVQRFGRGRSAALTIGNVYKWGLHDEASHRDMDKFWRQLMRWIVADVPDRVELHAETKAVDQNQAVLLQVRTRDKKFQPLDNATVKMSVRSLGAKEDSATGGGTGAERSPTSATNAVVVAVEPAMNEAGLYQASYIPRDTGGYLAEVTVTDSSGIEVGVAEAGWTADPAADEFRSLKPNRALLEAIAKKTGGEVIAADRLTEFAKSLPNRKAPITESASLPLWHTPWMFLLALSCFVAEWGLRRWKGLA